MKFQSINFLNILILLVAISLMGCDDSGLNSQADIPSDKSANFIGV